jgi:DNA-binding MarR family transcriptional regulator
MLNVDITRKPETCEQSPKAKVRDKVKKRRGKSKSRIKLTERDMEMLNFINDFGFCEMPQIEKRFSLKKPRSYQLIKRLIKTGFLRHERVFYGQHGIYRLTRKGSRCTELPPLARITLANYKHDIELIEVYLKLRDLHPEAQWISERKLKRDKYIDGLGKRGHLPDGMLIFPDGKEVAIEIELTAKGKNRVEKILKWYAGEFDIKEVWYYCPPSVVAFMKANAARMAFVKVYDLYSMA